MPSVPASNHLLAGLAVSDFALLQPHLEATDLPLRRGLEYPNKPIQHVYFVERGIVSVVAGTRNDGECEIGIVGREGMTGIQILVGSDRSPHQTYVQVAGHALRIEAVRLRKIMEENARLRNCLLLFVPAFMAQTAQTAVANGRAKLEQRLARWLLMAHDRLDGNEITLTHEFLALMLSVRRAGVTEAIQRLEEMRLVEAKRGAIVILDRAGLKTVAKRYYGIPEAEYRRLTGQRAHK
jgi:CRP-like cAMP-binding protein